ncbi:MAG: ribonuclease HI family protein [Planctomycetes bacterium]|nr:ribonuclease HI family protein [Planctomycetota bacterium]
MTPVGPVVIRFDGGSRGNPGPAASGFVIEVDGETVIEEGHYLGRGTNNEAEYDGLIRGLERALDLHLGTVVVCGDSELVIRQMEGKYKVRAAHLKKLHKEAASLVLRFASVEFCHVPRSENAAADRILNQALTRETDVLE